MSQPCAVTVQELLPHTFRAHVATPRFFIHAARVRIPLLLVFKVLCHIHHMSSVLHDAENTMVLSTH